MKRFLAMTVILGLAGGSAMAADLNLAAQSGGSSSIEVDAGEVVDYVIFGELSDASNEGLALFGFSLLYSGGDLAQASAPAGDITDGFVSPNGINNPAGFGGTIIDGNLVQVGGGQNTIKNTEDNAPFPIGMVITGLAQPGAGEVLAAGSLTIPGDATDGQVFTLSIEDVFANVIKSGETGDPFYKTEAAGMGAITDLTMTVASADCTAPFSSDLNCEVDARQPTNTDGSGSYGWDSVELNFDGSTASCSFTESDFSVTSTSGTAPGVASVVPAGNDVTVSLDGPIPAGAWTCIEYLVTGGEVCLGYLPADVSGDGTAAANDILALIDSLNGVTPRPDYATDADQSGLAGAPDILRVIDLLNGAGSFDIWIDQTLGACPTE